MASTSFCGLLCSWSFNFVNMASSFPIWDLCTCSIGLPQTLPPPSPPTVARLNILKYHFIPEASHFIRNEIWKCQVVATTPLTSSLTSFAPVGVAIFSPLSMPSMFPSQGLCTSTVIPLGMLFIRSLSCCLLIWILVPHYPLREALHDFKLKQPSPSGTVTFILVDLYHSIF